MDRVVRLIKKVLALVIVLAFSIESFAAVVGDNDGAAFITKAEFDSLKSSFQEQIDGYNRSIDNKIDGAIASYLDGIKNEKVESVVPYFIRNAGTDSSIKSLTSSDLAFAKSMSETKIDIVYSNMFNRDGGTYSKCWYATLKNGNGTNGQRNFVQFWDKNGGYIFKGHATNYKSKLNVVLNYMILGVDGGFVKSSAYGVYAVCNTATYTGSTIEPIDTYLTHLNTNCHEHANIGVANSGSILYGTATYDLSANTLDNVYGFAVSDNVYDIYMFDLNNTSTVINDPIFCYTNYDFMTNFNLTSGRFKIYATSNLDDATGPSTRLKYWNPANTTYNSGWKLKSNYWSTLSPIKLNDNLKIKLSDIYYNDTSQYTYNCGGITTSLNGYSMVAGIPFIDVKTDEKVKWHYKFSAADVNRKIYFKYGEFNGTISDLDPNNSDVIIFNAPDSEGDLEFTSEKSDMIFVKWTEGSMLDCSESSQILKTSS